MTDETSAQEAAVDAMRSELRRHRANTANGKCVCGWAPDPDGHRSNQFQDHVESSVLAVLLSPTKKPCAECEGVAMVTTNGPAGVPHTVTCPDCIDGFVLGPAPIEGLLERADTVHVVDPGGSARRFPTAEPVFRLPSKVREG